MNLRSIASHKYAVNIHSEKHLSIGRHSVEVTLAQFWIFWAGCCGSYWAESIFVVGGTKGGHRGMCIFVGGGNTRGMCPPRRDLLHSALQAVRSAWWPFWLFSVRDHWTSFKSEAATKYKLLANVQVINHQDPHLVRLDICYSDWNALWQLKY